MLKWFKLTISSLIFFYSCSEPIKDKETKGVFESYFEDTFSYSVNSTTYIIIISKQLCGLCENSVFQSFVDNQNKIKSKDITLITDINRNDIDTLLSTDFKPKVLIDSISNFSNYSFPRSYITIYKIKNGEVTDYAFFSENEKLDTFLKKENLLK